MAKRSGKIYGADVVVRTPEVSFSVRFDSKKDVEQLCSICLLSLASKAMKMPMRRVLKKTGAKSEKIRATGFTAARRRRSKFSDDFVKKFSDYYSSNPTIILRDIAKHFKVSISSLAYLIKKGRKLGYIKTVRPRGGFKKILPKTDLIGTVVTKETSARGYPIEFRKNLVDMVIKDPSLPLDELSEKYGPKSITIYSWIKKYAARKPNVTWTRKIPVKRIADSPQITPGHSEPKAEARFRKEILNGGISPSNFSFEFSPMPNDKTKEMLDVIFENNKMLRYDVFHKDFGFKGRVPCSKWFKFLAEVKKYYRLKDGDVDVVWIPSLDGIEVLKK